MLPTQSSQTGEETPFDARVTPAPGSAATPDAVVPLPSYDDDLGLTPGSHSATSVREPVAAPAPAATFYTADARADRRARPTPSIADVVAPGTLPVASLGEMPRGATPLGEMPGIAVASTRISRRSQFLESVDIVSAFRIGALVSAFTWSILGLFLVILPAALGVSIGGMMHVGGASGVANGRDIGAAFVSYLFTILLGSIITGAAFGLAAWGYNIIAASLGGLEMEVTQSEVH